MTAAAYEAEVYSNEQWKVYRVPGTVAQLNRAFGQILDSNSALV